MTCSYTLCDSIERTKLEDWKQLLCADGDPFMDPRFVATVEHSMAEEGKYWTLIIYDGRKRPVATACLSLLRVDGAILTKGRIKGVINAVRRLWGSCLYFNILCVGLPVSVGQSHLRIREDADLEEVYCSLDAVLRRLAARHRATLIVLKEFDAEQSRRLAGLRRHGYLRADSLPMNHFQPAFRDFDGFCAAMRARYRYGIERTLRKFHKSGFRVVRVSGAEGADRLYTDEVHRLYEAVLDHAEAKLERLPAEFFRELARQMPDQSVFTFFYREQRVVGFICSLMAKRVFYMLVLGMDYVVNPEADVYFNLILQELAFGLRQNPADIYVGQNSDTFKARIGCYQRPRYLYVKGCGVLRGILPVFSGMFFPPVELVPPMAVFRKRALAGEKPALTPS